MPEYTVSSDQLPHMIEVHEKARGTTILRGIRLAVERAKVDCVRATPVDQGEARRGWEVVKVASDEMQLRNDTVHAEVLELGRRPGRKPPPLEPILEWVYRHADELGVGNARVNIKTRKMIGVEVTGAARDDQGRYLKGKGTQTRWVVEDIEADALNVARAIQRKIGREGSPALAIVASRLERFQAYVGEEITTLLNEGLQ